MQEKIELVDGKFVVKGKQEIIKEKKRPEPKQYSLEVIALRDRVIAGNRKLFDAWMKIREVINSSKKEALLDKLKIAQDKLHYLCLELEAKGYEDCLYLDENGVKTKNCLNNPDGFWCQVCPSKYPYWQKDAVNL